MKTEPQIKELAEKEKKQKCDCDPFFIKTDINGYCKKCSKYLGYVRK